MNRKLRVLVYCMRSAAPVVYRASGVFPVTCLPFTAETFNPKVFERADFIWLGLHGVPASPDYLFGDELPANPFPIRLEALSVEGISKLNLKGKLVFAATCYMSDTNFPEAFKEAGAAVIGGPGENFGSLHRILGVDKLGQSLIANFTTYRNVAYIERTLCNSKSVLTDGKADRDASEFGVL